MKILLINPNAMPYREQEALLSKESILRCPTFSMPVGLMDLAAYVRQHTSDVEFQIVDFGVALYDFYLNLETREPLTTSAFLRSQLDKVRFTPDIVGISLLFASSHNTALELTAIAKEKWPGCVTIFGGNQATNIYKTLLKVPNIDYVVRGEAELTFVPFVEEIRKDRGSFNITGIYDRAKAEQGGPCETSAVVQDLTDLPMPAFDLADVDFYRRTVGGSLMWSRGCPFLCTFCATTTVHGRTMRYKSNEQCVGEVKHLVWDRGFTSIFIEDDLFAAKKSTFIPLADQVAAVRRDCKFELPQGISVAVMDEDRVNAMLRMGISQAAVAIESGSPYVQKYIMKKNVDLNKARRLLAYMRSVGFNAHTNFILGSPGETDSMRQETLDYMKTIDVNWIYIFHALPLPGSEMFDQFNEVADMRSIDWDSVRLGLRKFDTKDITAAALEEIVYDTNIDLNFFNNSNYRHGRYDLAVRIWSEFILRPFPFHTVGRYCRAITLGKLGRDEEAARELDLCVDWIYKNSESKRLYERYKDRMPELVELIGRDQTDRGVPERTTTLMGGRVMPEIG